MPEEPVLPLKKIRPIERAVTWSDFAGDINLFLEFLQTHFVVDSSRLNNIAGAVVSNSEPSPTDRDKIWINKESPYFIAIFAEGEWRKFYKTIESGTTPPATTEAIWIKTGEPFGIGGYDGFNWQMVYKYPVGIPMRWLVSNTMPVGMRDCSAQEITNYELTAPTNSLWKWVMFSPPAI